MTAGMVWLLPLAEGSAAFVLVILTVIAAAGVGHIIAGSVEAMYGAWHGAISWSTVLGFIVPALMGNCVGGVAFVAAISTAEIASEKGTLAKNKGMPSKKSGASGNNR